MTKQETEEREEHLITQKECGDLLAYHWQRAQDVFTEHERQIANLERENRKLNDKLNRFRNLTPGRKRLYALGRIAAMMEADADMMDEDLNERPFIDGEAVRADALYLHRLQWDLEQLREVVYPSKQPAHEWRRP